MILVALGLSKSDLPRDVVAPGLRWPSSFSWLLLAFRKKLDLVALGPLQEVIKPRDAVAPGLRWLVFISWFLLAFPQEVIIFHSHFFVQCASILFAHRTFWGTVSP